METERRPVVAYECRENRQTQGGQPRSTKFHLGAKESSACGDNCVTVNMQKVWFLYCICINLLLNSDVTNQHFPRNVKKFLNDLQD